MSSGIIQYLFYFIVLVIIILLILILVNYTIHPIFKLRPGDKGVIGFPGSDDSNLYWKNGTNLLILDDKKTALGSLHENWSMSLDIQVDNPTSNTNTPRILFTRGQPLLTPTIYSDSDTILTLNPTFNVCMYLDRLTNDLYVSVQTKGINDNIPSIETISVPNIPVRKSVRVGVFIGSRVLEVYINGFLLRSKAFANQLKSNRGSLQPPTDTIISSTARVGNLRIWARPVSPAEFRSYGASTDFNIKEIADSCVA
jgi:hypothetical protein